MSRLSTHVLDTMRGVGARGVRIDVHRIDAGIRERVAAASTNAQGRTDAPLLEGDSLIAGVYELTFHVGSYFAQANVALPCSTPARRTSSTQRFASATFRASGFSQAMPISRPLPDSIAATISSRFSTRR